VSVSDIAADLRLVARLARALGRALFASPLAPLLRVGRRNRRRRDLLPVEDDARVLRLERAPRLLVERFASDLDARRRPEPIDHFGARAAAAHRRLHELEVLVSALVPCEAKEGHAAVSARAAGVTAALSSSPASPASWRPPSSPASRA